MGDYVNENMIELVLLSAAMGCVIWLIGST